MSDSVETVPFSALLRQQRLAAGLTQATLAERAGIAARTVQDLELGIARPRRETVRRLVAALAPSSEIRACFEAVTPAPRDRGRRRDYTSNENGASGRPEPGDVPAIDRPGGADSQARLPMPLTSLVGREGDLAAVAELLTTTRLLTLTGLGGVGKTRLAIEVARAARADSPRGTWLVELAALSESVLIPQAIARVAGIAEQPGRPLLETLVDALETRKALLVLDNCEHLLDSCATLVQRLLESCVWLQVLATSREPLGVAGEVVWRVSALDVPGTEAAARIDATLTHYGSVRLLIDRARLVQPAFALTEMSAPAVIEICRRLDGIPLAIELAVARMPILTIGQIAARLDDALGLLTRGHRMTVPRHRTLRATLDWSYDLLADREQTMLRRVAVFAGGWTFGAAEMICAGDGIDGSEVLDLLSQLVDASLVTVEQRTDEARYRLLEPVRQYALERLQQTTDEAAVHDRHTAWCLALTDGADPALRTANHPGWRDKLRVERDNLRAALAWCLDHDQPTGLRLASRLGWWWWVESTLQEGRHWLEAYLGRYPGQTVDHAWALLGLGRLALGQGEQSTARARYEASLALSRQTGDVVGQTEALRALGSLLGAQGAVEEARTYLDAGLALVREVGNQRGIAGNLAWLGNFDLEQGEYARAEERLTESLEIARTLDDPWLLVSVLTYLGAAATMHGEYRRASERFAEAATAMQEGETPAQVGVLYWWMAHLAYCQADLARSGVLYEQSLAVGRRLGGGGLIVASLHSLARVALARGDPDAAIAQVEEGLRLMDDSDDVRRSNGTYVLGLAAMRQGEGVRGAALLRESLSLRVKARRGPSIAASLEALARTAIDAGQAARAARLLGAADSLRASVGAPLPPVERVAVEAATDTARASLGANLFVQAWAEGQAMNLEQAVAHALDESVPS